MKYSGFQHLNASVIKYQFILVFFISPIREQRSWCLILQHADCVGSRTFDIDKVSFDSVACDD